MRAASQDDLDALVALYRAASDELSDMRGGAVLLGLGGRSGDVARSFATQIADPSQHVVVCFLLEPTRAGRTNAGPVGYGTCRVRELAGGELLGSIEELYVGPEARRAGAGRAIAGALIEWCQSRGCTAIDAKALPGSRAVKSFFEGEGFTARLLVMHRRL